MPLQTLAICAATGEATGLELLQFTHYCHLGEGLIDGSLLPHRRLADGIADLLVGEDLSWIGVEDEASDTLYLALIEARGSPCGLLVSLMCS